MKNVKKRILIIAGILLVLLLAADLAGANYLISFGISRSSADGDAVEPEPTTTQEARDRIGGNRKAVMAKRGEWLAQAEMETVSITSEDGLKLVADISISDPESSRWAILVHGYSCTRSMMYTYARMFAEQGYNLLMPDLRGHGESEGDYICMGWQDRLDMLQWIDVITGRDPESEIVLFGVSMGAATVVMTAGEELPANVKAIVEDCGYTSVWDVFSDEMKALFNLPDFPLLHTARLVAIWRAGYDICEASALEQVKKAQVPMLFIHGSEDNFVRSDMVYELYEACPTEKELYVVENAGHAQSYYYEPEAYENTVFSFLAPIIA